MTRSVRRSIGLAAVSFCAGALMPPLWTQGGADVQAAQPAAAAAAQAPELIARAKQYAAALKSRDVARLVPFYAENATVMPPNAPSVTGRRELEAAARKAMEGSETTTTPAPVESEVSGDFGYIRGTYVTTGKSRDGKPMNETGKYVEVWKRVNGEWLIAQDIWNMNAPPPPPAAPTPPMPPVPPRPKQ